MTTLYHSIVKFFEDRMTAHSCVTRLTRLDVPGDYIFAIERTNGRKVVNVFLSDAYYFGEADYLGRPKQIKRGDFILIARPEGGFSCSVAARAKEEGIGIGAIGRLMGALNVALPSDYMSPEERERERQRKNFFA